MERAKASSNSSLPASSRAAAPSSPLATASYTSASLRSASWKHLVVDQRMSSRRSNSLHALRPLLRETAPCFLACTPQESLTEGQMELPASSSWQACLCGDEPPRPPRPPHSHPPLDIEAVEEGLCAGKTPTGVGGFGTGERDCGRGGWGIYQIGTLKRAGSGKYNGHSWVLRVTHIFFMGWAIFTGFARAEFSRFL